MALSPKDYSAARQGAIPSAVLAVAERRGAEIVKVKNTGLRAERERPLVEEIEARSRAEMEAAWTTAIDAEIGDHDARIGEKKASGCVAISVPVGESTADREYRREARQARIESLLLTQLMVGHVRTVTDPDELLAHFADAHLSNDPDRIRFVGAAVRQQFAAGEAKDMRQHRSQPDYRSPWSDGRSKIDAEMDAWRAKHPGVAEEVRRLEMQRDARRAELSHLKSESMTRLLDLPAGFSRPERQDPKAPEPAGTGEGAIVYGRAFSPR